MPEPQDFLLYYSIWAGVAILFLIVAWLVR